MHPRIVLALNARQDASTTRAHDIIAYHTIAKG